MKHADKELLLRELDEKFKACKKQAGFSAGFDEIEDIFHVKDFVLSSGFVSDGFSRQLCARIAETFIGWNNYLHGLVLPHPQNMMNMNESKMFSHDEKTRITELISKSMGLISMNSLAGLTKDSKTEAEFIDGAVKFWKESYGPKISEIIARVNKGWKS